MPCASQPAHTAAARACDRSRTRRWCCHGVVTLRVRSGPPPAPLAPRLCTCRAAPWCCSWLPRECRGWCRVLPCTTPRSFGSNSDSLCAKACMLNVCTSMNTRVHTRIVSRSHARARRRATRETNSYSFSRGSEHGNRQFETSSSRLSRHRSKRICRREQAAGVGSTRTPAFMGAHHSQLRRALQDRQWVRNPVAKNYSAHYAQDDTRQSH